MHKSGLGNGGEFNQLDPVFKPQLNGIRSKTHSSAPERKLLECAWYRRINCVRLMLFAAANSEHIRYQGMLEAHSHNYLGPDRGSI